MQFDPSIEQKIQKFLERERSMWARDGYGPAEVARLVAPTETFLRICIENWMEDGLAVEDILGRLV